MYITPNTNSQTIIKDLENGTYLLKIYELSGNINFNSTNCYVVATGKGENNQYLSSMMEFALHNNKQYQVKSLENCKLTTVKFYIGPGITFNNYRFKIMMTKSSDTSLPYVEHKHQTFTFPLGNEKLMLGDYLADDGIHHVRKQIVLNGSENWTVHASIASWFHWDGLTDGFVDNTISGYALSNYFTQKPYSTVTSLNNGEFAYGQVAGATRKRLVLKDTDYTTAADFKTWLSTHNVTVEYELEEEVIVPYTLAQQEVYNQIKQTLSYEEQTNISSNQNALFNVEAYQSTKLLLENFESRLTLVEG